jgi:hypothetical protein
MQHGMAARESLSTALLTFIYSALRQVRCRKYCSVAQVSQFRGLPVSAKIVDMAKGALDLNLAANGQRL